MSGIDRDKIPVCGRSEDCEFRYSDTMEHYWKGVRRGVIFYVNGENYWRPHYGFTDKDPVEGYIVMPKRLLELDFEQFVRGIDGFICDSCGSRVLPTSPLGKKIILFMKIHWDKRYGKKS